MTYGITVEHTFETGHRLPHLEGKCTSLHGHSWKVAVTVTAPDVPDCTVVEFSTLKRSLRDWIDTHLDHGLMLGATDPLVPVLARYGKVFRFGAQDPTDAERYATGLAWPTVEHVAALLARVASGQLLGCTRAPGANVSRVCVRETSVNSAEWSP